MAPGPGGHGRPVGWPACPGLPIPLRAPGDPPARVRRRAGPSVRGPRRGRRAGVVRSAAVMADRRAARGAAPPAPGPAPTATIGARPGRRVAPAGPAARGHDRRVAGAPAVAVRRTADRPGPPRAPVPVAAGRARRVVAARVEAVRAIPARVGRRRAVPAAVARRAGRCPAAPVTVVVPAGRRAAVPGAAGRRALAPRAVGAAARARPAGVDARSARSSQR